MAFDLGFDFRATAGYVSDPANCSPVLAEAYPHTYSNGAVAGWEDAGIAGRDRNNTVNARLAGMNFTGATAGVRFRVDLPASGGVTVHYAGSDPLGSSIAGNWDFKDGTTLLFSLTDTGAGSNFQDANGSFWSSAAWPGSEVGKAATFATTIFRLVTRAAEQNAVAHLRLVQTGGAAGKLFLPGQLAGLGSGGPFFQNPLGRAESRRWWRAYDVPRRKRRRYEFHGD